MVGGFQRGAFRQQMSEHNRMLHEKGKPKDQVTVSVDATVLSAQKDFEGELEVGLKSDTPVSKIYFPEVIPLNPGDQVRIGIVKAEKDHYLIGGPGHVPEMDLGRPVYLPRDLRATERAYRIDVLQDGEVKKTYEP